MDIRRVGFRVRLGPCGVRLLRAGHVRQFSAGLIEILG